jgi:hypothetical protein
MPSKPLKNKKKRNFSQRRSSKGAHCRENPRESMTKAEAMKTKTIQKKKKEAHLLQPPRRRS